MSEARLMGPGARGGNDGTRRTTVQSVERADLVLQCLAEVNGPLSVLEVARRTGLNRTIVHRLVQTLNELGMVEEAQSGHYGLGPSLAVYGQGYLDRLPVRKLALPYMLELSRGLAHEPWVVALAVPVGPFAVLVDRLWQRDAPLDTLLALGTRLPFPSSAHGRAMLATFPPERAIALVGEDVYASLADDLVRVRERGHLDFADGELLPGIGAVAIAIPGHDGQAVGSLAVSGSDLSAHLDLESDVCTRLIRTAHGIAQTLPAEA